MLEVAIQARISERGQRGVPYCLTWIQAATALKDGL